MGTVSPHLSRREVVPINDPKNIAILQRNEMGNLFTVKKTQPWVSSSATREYTSSFLPLCCWCCSSVAKSCPTCCKPMDCSTPGFSVLHHLPELAQTHIHWVGDAIQPSHPLLSPSPPALNLSQHQGLFQWVGSSHQVAKGLQLQCQHRSFQWIFRVDLFLDWLARSPCSPRDSQESSPTPPSKSISSFVLSLLSALTHISIYDCWKNHSFNLYGPLLAKWRLRYLIYCLGWP